MLKKQIRFLWDNMDPHYRRSHVTALCISVFTCLLLLVNPTVSQRIIDDVIQARNPDPLLGVMLAVKLGREGLRYWQLYTAQAA